MLVAAAALLAVLAATVSAKPAKPLFADSEMLRLTITAPAASFTQGKAKAENAVAATLAVEGAAPDTLAITLAPRGLTRRKREVCAFPPLRIEFPAKPAAGSLFAGQKRLKLVSHCRPGEGFQQFLLVEYAAYRLYNALTPASFAVRLASISYVDDSGKPVTTRLGFLIETTGDMAKRNDSDEFETAERILVAQLAPADAARFAVFQYMIGNLDWAMNMGPPGANCC
ncbi:MAG: hypothetical protein ACRCUI_02970, partial [Polymorphobacter sp.]